MPYLQNNYCSKPVHRHQIRYSARAGILHTAEQPIATYLLHSERDDAASGSTKHFTTQIHVTRCTVLHEQHI